MTLAGCASALAALAHVACVLIGAPAYRAMGAGERMARAAEAGLLQPTVLTLGIAGMLGIWALYAFSAAGLLPRLPLMRWALVLISTVYLARAFAFPLLMASFPENSLRFWLVSSSICLAIGALHAWGTWSRWAEW